MANAKKSEKDVFLAKTQKLLTGVATWWSFYRHNPHRFAKEYLNVDLKPFQSMLLYQMFKNDHFLYIAARGQGKTWLTALFAVCMCLLYPGITVVIASATRLQANEMVLKITEDFMAKHDWGSENLRNEIKDYGVSLQKTFVEFKCSSIIKVVTASDNSRGGRCNVLVLDEFRMLDPSIIQSVLRRFKAAPRLPGYMNNPKYSHLVESNKELYLSSAWLEESIAV